MSGQRYIPSRDRSPPRSLDRFVPTSTVHPERASNFAPSPTTRDPLSRDSRLPIDSQRPGFGASSYSRGRGGFSSRPDYRSDYRDRDPRDRRDDSPYGSIDRDRAWRDRDSDRGRSPPRTRDRDFRDFRDAPRGRGRRGSFDSDTFPASRGRGSIAPSVPARGSFSRGRVRGSDWDFRAGRGRGHSADDRHDLLRPHRSRSPARERGSRWPDDDRAAGRRDDYRPSIRDDRIRDTERFRDASPEPRAPATTRRPSLPSINVSTTSSAANTSSQAQSARPYDSRDARDNSLRRTSTVNVSEPPRDGPRELLPRPNDASNNANPGSANGPPPRVNSPPRPTDVPAFGSVPIKPVQQDGWNIWRAPPTEPKAARQTSMTSSTSNEPQKSTEHPGVKPDPQPLPPTAPRAERLSLHGQAEQRSGASVAPVQAPLGPGARLVAQAPTAPAAERDNPQTAGLARSPPTGPRFLSASLGPRGPMRQDVPMPSARSPPMPPTVPTGPRGSGPPAPVGAIPTGPRAERAGPPIQAAPRQAPLGPSAMPSWQRSRTGPPTPIIPSKRDFAGESKDQQLKSSPRDFAKSSPANVPPSASIHAETFGATENGSTRGADPASQLSDRRLSVQHGLNEDEEEDDDLMDLDERDVEENEAKFERGKAALEAKKVDANSDYYRAVDLTKRLALLHSLSLKDFSSLFNQKLVDDTPVIEKAQEHEVDIENRNSEDMLTPKTEEKEADDSAADAQDALMHSPISPGPGDVSPPTSPPSIGSPEIKTLPYLNQEPLTPLSELEIYQDNLNRNEAGKEQLLAQLVERTRSKFNVYAENCHEYADRYRVWRLEVQDLERETTDFEKEEAIEEPAAAETLPDTSPMLPTPTEQTGRRSRYTSEYSLEQALKKSQETARAEQLQREREAAQAKRDPDREADIPEMVTGDSPRASSFLDTTYRRSAEWAVKFWQLQPPEDDFTPEEHKTMIENFRAYPKKWGKIAQALEGRTYKDCINHYYATKWNKEFKPKVKSRNRKSAKGAGKLPGGKALRANHLLNDVGVDVYGADDAAAPLVSRTSGGRPKRAAAPTSFNEDQNTAKKGPRPAATTEQNPEKGARKGKGAPRGAGTQRKSGRNAARQRTPSPPKTEQPTDVRQTDMSVPSRFLVTASEVVSSTGLAAMTPTLPQTTLMRPASDGRFGHVQDLIGPTQGMPGFIDNNKSPAANPGRGAPSSYWSVQETTKFPEYLGEFGSDWQAISNQMGSKSATMVKNHYQRLVGSGRHDIQELATRADEGRARSDKVPAESIDSTSTAASPTKHRLDALSASAPRTLAPSRTQHEIIDIDDDSPVVAAPASSETGFPRFSSYATSLPTSLATAPPHQPLPTSSVIERRESVDWRQGISRLTQGDRDYAQPYGDRYAARLNERPSAWDTYRASTERGATRLEDDALKYRRAGQSGLQQIPEPPTFPRPSANDDRPQQPVVADRAWGARAKPDILQPTPADRMSHAHAGMGHFGRQSPPSQARMSAFSPHQSFAAARAVDITGREVLRHSESRPNLSSTPGYGAEAHQPRSGPPTPFYERGQRTSWGAPAEESRANIHTPTTEDRARNTPSGPASATPRSQTPTAAAAQPSKPKKSNLSALLNPEPEDPKPQRPKPPPPSSAAPRARTPPPPLYGSHVAPPQRPASQIEPRQNLFGDVRQTPSAFQSGPLTPLSHASPPLPSHEIGRSHSSLHERPPAIMQPASQPGPQHPFSRPMDPPGLQQRHTSLQNLRAPANASPPPQAYGYVQQQLHGSGPLHSRQSSFSRPPAGPFAERREAYSDRPYAPGNAGSRGKKRLWRTWLPTSTFFNSLAPPPFEGHYAPNSASARYGPPGGNSDAHMHNSAILPGYSQAQRDPFGSRSFSGGLFDRERDREQRERRDREEQDRSRQAGGPQHQGYGFLPGRDR